MLNAHSTWPCTPNVGWRRLVYEGWQTSPLGAIQKQTSVASHGLVWAKEGLNQSGVQNRLKSKCQTSLQPLTLVYALTNRVTASHDQSTRVAHQSIRGIDQSATLQTSVVFGFVCLTTKRVCGQKSISVDQSVRIDQSARVDQSTKLRRATLDIRFYSMTCIILQI